MLERKLIQTRQIVWADFKLLMESGDQKKSKLTILTTRTVSSVPSIGEIDFPQAAHFGEYRLFVHVYFVGFF